MPLPEPSGLQQLRTSSCEDIHDHWALFLVEGLLLLVLGVAAVLAPVLASIAATLLFGWILLIVGGVGLVTSIRARHAPGLAWSLLSAIIGIVAGALLLFMPLHGAFSLTAVLIAFLALEGLASILYALEHRRGLSGRWGWMLVSGIIDIGLAAILFAGFPWTAFWALGLIVGINLIFGGWAMIGMALSAKGARP